MALEIGDRAAETAELKDEVRLSAEVRKKVLGAVVARERAEVEKANAQESIAEAVRVLKKLRLSMRDAGDLIGLSHQRVQQLLQEGEARVMELAGRRN